MPKDQLVVRAAVMWAEVHYLRQDLNPSEVELLAAVNTYLQSPEGKDHTEWVEETNGCH